MGSATVGMCVEMSERHRREINEMLMAAREPADVRIARAFITQTFLDHARLAREEFRKRYDERLLEVETLLTRSH